MSKFEPWPEAYDRILNEVREEFRLQDEQTQYRAYRKRCAEWKQARRIKLSTKDLEALGYE